MTVFATLGPSGSNHELVTRRYLAFHGLDGADIVLIDDFLAALDAMARGEIDHIVQAAAHYQYASTVAQAYFRHGIVAIDSFIAPSRPLAILTRAEIETPRTIALQPATRDYADLSAWSEQIDAPTIIAVGDGLLAGDWDSGITALDLASEHPGRFRVDTELGSVDDPWVVYGRTPVRGGVILAWRGGPAGRLLREE